MKKPTSLQPTTRAAVQGPPAVEVGGVASPIDSLLEELQSALGLRRRDALGRIQGVESALAAYRRAVEERIVFEFTRDHQLRAPKLTGLGPEAAAERLREAVLALPELAAPPHGEPAQDAALSGPPPSRPALPERRPADEPLPRLAAQGARKIVVIGALAGRQRSEAIPAGLLPQTEWVDTESGGAHAIGNLPQRIRQGRVAALVILDRAVQHKHTEPLVSAARAAAVPVGFAGKGGAASIRRALVNIEEQLAGRPPSHRP